MSRPWDSTFGHDWDSKHRNASETARDALVIVKEGNAQKFREKYGVVFQWLVDHNYLVSPSRGNYELTPLGMEVIERKRTIELGR